MLFLCVGSQIILSTILIIRNNNHIQEYKIYVENYFSLKEKTIGQISNNFTIVKSITIIIVYVSRLKKNLSYFSLLSHTLIIYFKGGNTLLSPPCLSSRRRQLFTLSSLAIFLKVAIPYSLFPPAFLPNENIFSLSWFHALFFLSS